MRFDHACSYYVSALVFKVQGVGLRGLGFRALILESYWMKLRILSMILVARAFGLRLQSLRSM